MTSPRLSLLFATATLLLLLAPPAAAERHAVTLRTTAATRSFSPAPGFQRLPWPLKEWDCVVHRDDKARTLTVDCFSSYDVAGAGTVVEGHGKTVLLLQMGRHRWRLEVEVRPDATAPTPTPRVATKEASR